MMNLFHYFYPLIKYDIDEKNFLSIIPGTGDYIFSE